MTTPADVTDVSLANDVARMVERLQTRDYLCDAMNPDGPEAADLLLRQQAVIGELRESVITFAGPWAAQWAREHELPNGHLHPEHYDLLERCGARMADFTRAALAKAR